MSANFSLFATGGAGVCALAFDGQRRLIATSSRDGRILVEDDGLLKEWTNTGGSPVGLTVDGNTVFIADSAHGAILSLSDEGALTVRVPFERDKNAQEKTPKRSS